MTGPPASNSAGCPQADRDSVLAVLHDQLDDLLAASQAQQATIDDLHSRVQATIDALRVYMKEPVQPAGPPPGGP